jgi:hypothetical protein
MCFTENSVDEWAESISQTLARAGAVYAARPRATNPIASAFMFSPVAM